ncbi:low molecular weight phosphotyrosine protein phosphatase [Aulographum hederae CBS 113979]|uniref:Low molecular weight phosphotyrosine protein phosphatase n=1 Tax=Aulographum hederae CBS 113979 TaxID=1176131 RepID=A0A6G1GPM1_9PEZI|nr:low molecular weight phosphotyrosine protein phosphatase [Aulographum hederae CBS 113979]
MTDTSKPVSVLFVCLGNICRSPMAEAVFNHLALGPTPTLSSSVTFRTDSAGTLAMHAGDLSDPRTRATLSAHKIPYTGRARKITEADFEDFDLILGMDGMNIANINKVRRKVVERKGGDEGLARVMLFGDFSDRGKGEEVVDPYYGGDEGFERCYEQMGRFSRGLVKGVEKERAEGKL